jgi:hypothetical protein
VTPLGPDFSHELGQIIAAWQRQHGMGDPRNLARVIIAEMEVLRAKHLASAASVAKRAQAEAAERSAEAELSNDMKS